MGNPFPTGRTTRLKFSGGITASTQTVEGGPDGTALADTSSQISIVCNGTTLTTWCYSKCDYGCQSNLIATLQAPDGYTTSGTETDGDGSGPSSSLNGNGSWFVEFDVEEWCLIYTPSSVSTVNSSPFPTFGGAAQGDGLPALGVQFYLTLKPGGTYSCGITSGSVSLSHSYTIPAASSVGFLIVPTVYCSASGGDSNTTSAGIQYTIGSGSAENIITTYHQVAPVTYGTMTVDATGGSVSAEVGSQGGCQITAYVNPPIVSDLSGRLRCWGNTYPGTAKVTWANAAGSTNTLTPSSGTFSDTATQQEWSCSGWYIGDSTGAHVNYPTQSVEQWQAAQCWLTNLGPSGSGDDPRDWRMQFSGFSWPAVSVSRVSTLEIDPCSSLVHWTAGANTALALSGGVQATVAGGTGGMTLAVQSAKRVWEAYRLLGVTASFTAQPYNNSTSYAVGDCCESGGLVYQCISPTTGHAPPNTTYWAAITAIPVTVGAGGASWTLSVGTSSAQTGLELPCGKTDLSTIGLVQSRFPINYPGGFPTNYDPITQYSFGWGVNYADSVTFGAIPNGCIVTVSDVSLISETNSAKQSAITTLEAFLDFVQGWTSPTDNTTVQPFFIVEADGKIIDIPALCLVTPTTGMGSPSYTWYTIAQIVSILNYFPGITATALADPTDGYHGSGLLALLLGGNGAVYRWDTSGWTDTVDVQLPQTSFLAQDLWDEVQLYPGAGQVWTESGSFGGSTPLRVSKSLRAQADGLCYNTDGTPQPGAMIKTFETANPSILEGSASSDAIAKYYTGTPWAFGNVDTTVQAASSPTPHLYWHSVIQNRQRLRTSFRYQPAAGESVDLAADSLGVVYRCVSGGESILITRYDLSTLFQQYTAYTGTNNNASIAIGPNNTLLVVFDDGTNAYAITSTNSGQNWSSPLSIAPGTWPEPCIDPQTATQFVAIYDGTNFNCWQQRTQDTSFTQVGTIVAASSGSKCGLTMRTSTRKELIFEVADNTGNVRRFISTNMGADWNEL